MRAAIKVAINAQFAAPRVLTTAEAMTATTDYIVVFISRRYIEGSLISGDSRVRGGRVTTRYVCRDEGNIAVFRDRTAAAIEEKFLPGADGPLKFETVEEDVKQDDGWFVSSDSWTY